MSYRRITALVTASLLIVNLLAVMGASQWGAALPSGGQVSFTRFVDGQYWLYLHDLASRLTLRLLPLPGVSLLTTDNHVRWSPDGEAVAYVRYLDSGQSEVIVQPVDGPARVFPVPGFVQSYRWSPDGSALAYGRVSGTVTSIHHVSLASGITARIDAPPGFAPVWSPYGQQIYYLRQDQAQVMAYDTAAGTSRVLWEYAGAVARSHRLIMPPQGDYLALTMPSTLMLYHLPTGHVRQIGGDVTAVTHPAWSPDGESVIVAQSAGPAPPALWRYTVANDQREWIAVGAFPTWESRRGLLYISPAVGLMYRDMTSGDSRRLLPTANVNLPAWRPGR